MNYKFKAACLVATALSIPAPIMVIEAQETTEISNETEREDGAQRRLDSVTVTARRRAESVQDVPVSVTAVSGEELEERNLTGLREVGSFVPNLSLSESGTNSNGAAVYIRGVGQSAPRVTLDPGVGIYIDGVYRQSLNGGFLNLLDIDRVEVLRGPQGTLYGRNTIGGAIKIETRRPSLDEFGGRVSGAIGNFDRLELDGTINVPLVEDVLALKVGASTKRADGYIKRPFGDESGNEEDASYAAQLRWVPSETVEFLLAVDSTTSDNLGLPKFATEVNENARNVLRYNQAVLDGIISGPLYTADLVITDDPRRTNETSPFAQSDFEDLGVSLTGTFNYDGFTLTSYTSYRENEQYDGFDSDGSILDVNANNRRFANDQFSQELQLNTTLFDGFVDFVGGVYYLQSDDDQFATQVVAPDVTLAGGPDRATSTGAFQSLTSYSVYGEGRFNLSEQFAVSFGARYVLDEKDVTGVRDLTALTNPTRIQQSGSDDWSSVSPRLLVEYSPNEDQLFYGSITKGFKSGGINDSPTAGDAPPPLASFDPEELWAYEVGSKSTFANGRALLNLAFFYSDYQDLQIRLLENTDFGLVRRFVNAGKARSYGLEVEGQALLTDTLRVNVAGAWLDSAFEEDVFDGRGTLILFEGEPLDRSPEFSYSVGLENTFPDVGPGDLTARIDYGWRDEQKFQLAGGEERLGADAYGLLNATLSYDIENVTLSLYGKNLTDEEYVTGNFDTRTSNGPLFFYLGRPLEVGARVRARF